MSIRQEIMDLLLQEDNDRFTLLNSKLEKIMATQAELITQINNINQQLTKVGQETSTLLTKIDELKQVIAAGPVSPELQAAVDALAHQAQVIDDLVPDTVPTP